jgi:hypothetical protein
MGKRKAHRAYAGGRRRLLRKLMRELHSAGEFDPSIFPSPRLSPLPPPEEVQEALGTEKPSMPELTETLASQNNLPPEPTVPPRKKNTTETRKSILMR